MTITFELGWWVIPTVITIVAVIWALFFVDDGGGWFSGLANVFALIPALAVSAIAWIIAGFLK